MSAPYSHLTADFTGVPAVQLRDTGLLGGLLIAAASAAGLAPAGTAQTQVQPSGAVTGWLQLDACHIAVHAFPDRGLLLLDVLADAVHDGRKVLDVFARRLSAREVRSEQRPRG